MKIEDKEQSGLVITLIQSDIEWGNPPANQQRAEKIIANAGKSDVYVLPEMWSTGFATKPEGIAEQDGESLAWMKNIAIKMDAAIAGSVATKEGDDYFNRFYFVKPDGSVAFYDKRHLFTYGGEHRHYTPGDKKTVVEWRGVRFLLMVCYDLRFPVFSRNKAEGPETYDVALYVASWPKTRRLPWNVLLRARAIENQCYVCGVNRVGNDGVCEYNGGTICIDAYGNDVASCDDDKEGSITFRIDLDRLRHFREKFPVLRDASFQQ